MRAWRIVKRRHSRQAFSGEGARQFGGRWNSPGVRVVYTAEHVSLAVLEVLVHLEHTALLPEYVLFSVEFAEGLLESLDPGRLPKGWAAHPAPLRLRAIGDRWVAEARSAVLGLPSAVVPLERVFLLNPQHPDFPKLVLGRPQPFDLDARLLKA